MGIAVITGASGLVGSEAVRYFADRDYSVVGIDNDMRRYFFGRDASTDWNRRVLEREISSYSHFYADIRDESAMDKLFRKYNREIEIIIHAAAQPSHDWAAKEPMTDFSVNAVGTLVLIEATRRHCPNACFIHVSTNKVYGDSPNHLPLEELETRWEIAPTHPYHENGIDETMSIDRSKHSLFGVSKASADLLVQEYGKYFGLKTGIFRGGCLTGGAHSGTELHGFLSYLMRCCMTGKHYMIYGYKGKQVRDNLHAHDLVDMFKHFAEAPRPGEVYNVGGGRHSHASVREAIIMCEAITGKRLRYTLSEENRIGDHIWWISDVSKFRRHYPEWDYKYDMQKILQEIHESLKVRLQKGDLKTDTAPNI